MQQNTVAPCMWSKVTVALTVVCFFVALCGAFRPLQRSVQRSASACDRHSTWDPRYTGLHSPICMHAVATIDLLLFVKKTGSEAEFASAAWLWLDDASACIFLVQNKFCKAIDGTMLENLKWYHQFFLHSALVADKEPLELDREACMLFTAGPGSLKILKVYGIKLHTKLAIKHFDGVGPVGGALFPFCVARYTNS
jgi:hypothetical protein